MAKNGNGDSKYGHMTTGRKDGHMFDRLVSPLGEDCGETPVYSPSREVTGAQGQRRGQISKADERQGDGRASQSYSAKDQRRGG